MEFFFEFFVELFFQIWAELIYEILTLFFKRPRRHPAHPALTIFVYGIFGLLAAWISIYYLKPLINSTPWRELHLFFTPFLAAFLITQIKALFFNKSKYRRSGYNNYGYGYETDYQNNKFLIFFKSYFFILNYSVFRFVYFYS